MKILLNLIYVIVAIVGFSMMAVNLKKIHDGCPADQVLIKSVATYECIRR